MQIITMLVTRLFVSAPFMVLAENPFNLATRIAQAQQMQIQTYNDPKGMFSLNYPSGWAVTHDRDGSTVLMSLPPDPMRVRVFVFGPVNPAFPPEQILKDFLDLKIRDSPVPISIQEVKPTHMDENVGVIDVSYTYPFAGQPMTYSVIRIGTEFE